LKVELPEKQTCETRMLIRPLLHSGSPQGFSLDECGAADDSSAKELQNGIHYRCAAIPETTGVFYPMQPPILVTSHDDEQSGVSITAA